MLGSQTIACVIPARLASTRFPRKMLASIAGKPILQWVFESASAASFFDKIVFAVDDKEVADLVQSFGGTSLMTSVNCLTGTDRLCELERKKLVDADVFVNWQGDEPFIQKEMILSLLQSVDDQSCDLWTLKKRLINQEDIESPNVVKVVCDKDDRALYFSRSTIPYYRDPNAKDRIYYKHIGIYAYRRRALQKIGGLSPAYIELAESLEQLRFLYNGLSMKAHETTFEVLGIDLPEHIAKAEAYLKQKVSG